MNVKADFPETETIDGIRFRCAPLRPKLARKLFLKAAPLLGAESATASAGAIAGMDPDDLDYMFAQAEDVTQYSEDGGAKWPYLNAANQEILFKARTLLSFKFLAFFLRAQFADFHVSPTPAPVGADPSGATPAS